MLQISFHQYLTKWTHASDKVKHFPYIWLGENKNKQTNKGNRNHFLFIIILAQKESIFEHEAA